ncbi:MAG: hypothetical protein NC087_01110 [Anaeroplasma bactoclasticum]|nr:hypothetical protein [Anaeroplasma bactoclasticum]
MRTCIQVACLDEGDDQSFYSYNSNGNTSLVSISRTSAEKVFSINSSFNNSIDGAMVYNFDNATKINKFAYKSTKSVNSYDGYLLYIFFDCDDSNPFKKEYCIDYMDSYPEWIKKGLTTKDVNYNLQNFTLWFRPNKTVNTALAKTKKKILSVIIDKILEIKKKDPVISSIGLVSEQLNAEDLHNILKCALRSLPVSLANQYSFDVNAGSSIRGLDIYCTTTIKEIECHDLKNLIINIDHEDIYENYKFNNLYAEYLCISSDFCSNLLENDVFDSLSNADEIIDELNSMFLSHIVNLRFSSSEDLTDVVLDDYRRILDKVKETEVSKKIGLNLASKIFFKSNFFSISKENKDYFFENFLTNDVDFDAKLDEKCINQVFNAANNSEDIKKYFAFLLDCLEKNVVVSIQKNIKSFLYDDFNDRNAIQSNKKPISMLVDYFLEESDKSSFLEIFSSNYDLISLFNIIKSALATLPKECRNLYQFEKIINEADAGFVLKKEKSAGLSKKIPIGIDINYSYKNLYAEYMNLDYLDAVSINENLTDSENVIEQLNLLAGVKLINSLYKKNILEEFDIDNCQKLLMSKSNEQLNQLSVDMAYKIFFSSNFYKICDESERITFFSNYLDGTPSNLYSKDNYVQNMISVLGENYSTEQINKYFDFLMDYYVREKNSSLKVLEESVGIVLYCNFDSYSVDMRNKFISWWQSMNDLEIRKYFSQCWNYKESEFINEYIQNAPFDLKMCILETYKSTNLKKDDENNWIMNIFKTLCFDKMDYFSQVYELLSSKITISKGLNTFFCLKFSEFLTGYFNTISNGITNTNLKFFEDQINQLDATATKLNFNKKNENYKKLVSKMNESLLKEKRLDILSEENQRSIIFDSELPITGPREEKRKRWIDRCFKERKDGKTGYKNNSGGKPMRFVISSLISYLIILVILWVLNVLIIPYLRNYGILTIFIKNEIICTSIFSIFLICGCFVIHLYYFIIACNHESYIRHTSVAFRIVVYYFLSVCIIFLMLLLSGLLIF